jgi:hypothetical protein
MQPQTTSKSSVLWIEAKNSYRSGCFSLVEGEIFAPIHQKKNTSHDSLKIRYKLPYTFHISGQNIPSKSFWLKPNIRILLSLVIMELVASEHGG